MKQSIGLVLTLFLAAIISLPSYSKEVTFTVISDTHIKSDKAENRLTPSINNLLKAASDINSSKSSFTVFLGDNINNPDKHDLVMFAKILKRFNKPVYTIIGNHDVAKGKGIDKKEYFRLLNKFSANKIRKVPCVKKIDGFVFVFMDGVNQTIPGPRGYYRDKELIWLDKTLNKYKNNDVIILQHFPVVAPTESETRQTYNIKDYFQTISKHSNIRAIISGHYHTAARILDEKSAIVHLSIPALYASDEYEQITVSIKNGKFYVINKILDVKD